MPINRGQYLLMLGSDTKLRLGFAARFEPRNEFLARLDRRHVDLVASHVGGSDGKGRDLTRRLQGRAIGSSATRTILQAAATPERARSQTVATIGPTECRQGATVI